MKIKTFHALSMQDALRSIREELGPDAVILSTKQVKKGNGMFGLFGRTMVEVAAAVDDGRSSSGRVERPAPASRQPAREREEPSAFARRERPLAQPHPRFEEALEESLIEDEFVEEPAPPRAAAPRPQTRSWPPVRPASAGPVRAERPRTEPPQAEPAPARTLSTQDWDSVHRELQSLRALVESTLRVERPAEPAAPAPVEPEPPKEEPVRAQAVSVEEAPPLLAARRQDLIERGFEAETAWKLMTEVAGELRGADRDSDAAIRQTLHRLLARDIAVGGPLMNLGEWKKTVIVTGATGVGKTTTVAKLAAHYKLKEKRSVGLITLDTYRVAAVEQLRMYANVIGVSLDVALTKREALDCIRRLGKTELILIDTTGRSPLDEAGMEELRDMISLDHPLETHLVVPATTRERDVLAGFARYAGVPISKLLFTKLDEGIGLGGMYELMRKTKLPVSYLSTGQNVPDDLEVATADRLSSLILGGPLRPATRPSATPARPTVAVPPPARSFARPAAASSSARPAPPASHAYQGGPWWIKR
jgi:flagellar biosynthesis protein FlhF